MSDKTCGNCDVWAHVANDIGVCSVGGTTIGEDDYFEIRNEFDDCRHPDSFEQFEYSLEQCYEQLEQVAKKLYMHAKFVHMRTGFEIDCIIMRHAKRELEALGVSLDD